GHLFTVGVSIAVIIALISVLFALEPGPTGNAITGGTSHAILEETLACDDGADNDNDGLRDCFDPDCWPQAMCFGQSCGAERVVTWSYQLPSEQAQLDSESVPQAFGCCQMDQCASAPGIPVACFDGGVLGGIFANRVLCNQIDQNIYTCSPETDGSRSQDGKYECDGAAAQWKVRCFADTKYWLNEDETQICDGNRFLTWEEWQDAGLYNPNIDVTMSPSGMTVTERNCNNGEDDDKDGKADGADVADCASPRIYPLGNTSRFSVLLNETDAFKVKIAAYRPGVSVPEETGLPALAAQDIYLCDPSLDSETAKVCYTENRVDKSQVIDSFAKLNRLGEKPKYVNNNPLSSTLFLYENEPASGHKKVVRITLVRDLTDKTTPFEFPFNIFAGNMLAEQRLVLVLDDEFYLLSYDTTQTLFSSSNLRLKHFPTGTAYPGVNYPGSNWYLFSVLGGKQIAVGAFGSKFLISALEPDEEPAAYVIPWDLTEQYEVKFTKNTPVKITAPLGIGQLTVCQDDNPRDREQIKVCKDDNLEVTLQRGQLTKRTIKTGFLEAEVALLFDVVPNTTIKQVSIFSLKSLSSAEQELDYDNFIDNMVAGRHVALEFPSGQLYLLQHPVADFLDLAALHLYADPAGEGESAFAGGSQVEFTTGDGGKIYIRRNYGTPPPPFKIWAKRADELERTDLVKDLSTSFSTDMPFITFSNPALGTVRTSADDEIRYQPTFQMSVNGAQHFLSYQTPYLDIDDNSLFYYYDYVSTGTAPEKKAAIYLLYDISEDEQTHLFTDQFIETFASGAELALKIEDSYYLLGHRGNPSGTSFYNPQLLTLKTLDGGQVFERPNRVISGVAQFEVTEGRIEVEVDIVRSVITFRKRKSFEPLTVEEFAKPYWAELTTTNSVTVAGTTLRMCFVSAYAASPFAKVCSDDATLPPAGVLLEPATIITIGSENYVLESNQRTGAEKRVYIRKLIQLNAETPFAAVDWLAFTAEIVENHKPVFNISGMFFLPSASDSQLQNFGFAPYAGGTVERPRNVQEITPISFNGSIVLYDKVIFLQQEETDDEEKPIQATMSVRPYKYLPDNREKLGVELAEGVPKYALLFISTIDKEIYRLGTTPLTNKLSWIVLQRVGEIEPLFAKFFAAGDIKRLTLDGIPVEIKLESIGDEEAGDTTKPTVTVKRSG
ncbi:hypothetical protein HYS49_02525, partial [Candidatus Woesearchaeota archaeon]|nr:hypothetical protein [Candidatus Woesearchaeota archaeon]